MQHDHALVGALIRHEIEPLYPSVVAMARALQIDRTTVYRVFDGDPRIKALTHRRAERILDLPQGSLDLVRTHDVTGLRNSGMREDALAWVLAQIQAGPEAGQEVDTM